MAYRGKRPVIGCAFDPDQRNEAGNIEAYINELRWYRPRGRGALIKEGSLYLRLLARDARRGIPTDYDGTPLACVDEWMRECDELLSDHARRIERHDYIGFGPFEHGGAVGFYIHVDGALEDADLKVDDLGEVPKGFTGLVCQVSDHGNVTAYRYSRGKARELFSAV